MARNLMIQGTMSGAGKSILTAGILRVLRQDGYRVAPFKSQNMALNSFVTRDGLEMGRAQVVQAAAAGLEPSADMNPILLKPMGDASSEVIVNGRPIGKMRAADYYRVKRSLVPSILEAYRRLEERSDIIVIEGAGSPVEINLREGDFVNMGLAEMVDAPVLLAGNIDPGGVFAQLLGTVQLLRPSERERVKGLIINKFRGDVSLLEPGLLMFREYCDIPFAGVVPWVKLDLDEEDSMSEKLAGKGRNSDQTGAGSAVLDIAVIRLPYMSNYTDFAPLEKAEGVNLRYIAEAPALGEPDLIILPGTKNTIGDLRWLRETGLARRIIGLVSLRRAQDAGLVSLDRAQNRDLPGTAASGTLPGSPLLMGICGGYQMLGQSVLDPLCSEAGGSEEGLGLLPVETVFREDKYTRQRSGRTLHLEGAWTALSDLPVSGYEIHMGETRYLGELRDNRLWRDGKPSGTVFADLETAGDPEGLRDPDGAACNFEDLRSLDGAACGNVLGTYLHGIFDEPEFREALLMLIRERKGNNSPAEGADQRSSVAMSMESARQMQDRQLDLLADVLRTSLYCKLIYEAIGV